MGNYIKKKISLNKNISILKQKIQDELKGC